MRVIVIDDEKAMHLVMKRLLSEIPGIVVAGCFQNANQALEKIQHENIDLVFIDIMIGQDHGLDVARQLRSAHNEIEIVFVTSHKEFAMESFDSYPLDYMIKPVSKSRLEQTLARAASRIKEKPTTTNNPPVRKLIVRAFGGFEVRSEQFGPAKWISKKSMELFAYLLMYRGRPVSKAQIIEQLYTGMPLKNAAIYINTNVYQLRKTLHAHGCKDLVVHSQDQYWLVHDHMDVDFLKFEESVSQFTAIQSEQLQQALTCEQLYTGELFEGRSYDWAISEQIRMHQLYAQFTKQLSRYLLTHQEAEQTIPLIKKLLLRDEWDEEANLLLLQAYGEMKDHISLEQHYDYISKQYQQELSTSLPNEFSQIYMQYMTKSR